MANHFGGSIGAPTCGEGVATPRSAEARELRSIVCEAFDLKLFTYTLTPHYDTAHADHFHMEVKIGARWFGAH